MPSAAECTASLQSLEDALYVIGGKWKLKIILALRDRQATRFNELQRTVRGISARVLSNELKDLEMNGFVKRIVHNSNPVVIEYLVTGYCASLEEVLKVLVEWGSRHRKRIIRPSPKPVA